jgi:hypothetical protein
MDKAAADVITFMVDAGMCGVRALWLKITFPLATSITEPEYVPLRSFTRTALILLARAAARGTVPSPAAASTGGGSFGGAADALDRGVGVPTGLDVEVSGESVAEALALLWPVDSEPSPTRAAQAPVPPTSPASARLAVSATPMRWGRKETTHLRSR